MASKASIQPVLDSKVKLQNGKAAHLRKRADFWRFVHLTTGFVFAAWLVLMALTGVLINHQADWNLDESEVSNAYLPGQYTTEYSPDATRVNVIVADLHSGNFFWGLGKVITDLVALLVLLSVSSGAYAFHLRKKVVRLCMVTCDLACAEIDSAEISNAEPAREQTPRLPPTAGPISAEAPPETGREMEEAEEEIARAG